MKVMGIDEAGRGAVIGPLVVCGLMIDESKEKELKKIGVKDSKELTPEKREELAEKIDQIADNIVVLHVSACNIDSMRKSGINLNQIEAMKMADAINMLLPEKVIIDSPSYNSGKFKDFLFSKLNEDAKKAKFVFENYADKNYPVVSAASIIAKVERDKKIEQLKKEFGFDFGVGYSHDAKTIEFLEKLAKENKGKMPKNIRTTWDTVQEIVKKYEQKGLSKFFDKFKIS
ncbi:MAG: ribonuclease HII [Candidatus Aenigmarchaeota archaeon]|nr:ribonuclease HII [Candidatus Aenigmarchaeota archaeon]